MNDNTSTTRTEQAHTCGEKCEVWSRVCGYFRPVSSWNRGKKQEFNERRTFVINGGAK